MMTRDRIAEKAGQLHEIVEQVIHEVADALDDRRPVHEVERSLLQKAIALGHAALQLMFDDLGHGDVGKVCELHDGRQLQRLSELRERPYQSVFGEFRLQRFVYARREGQKAELVPLDARLALPESKFSYLLQDFDQHLTMDQPFAQGAKTIERILGVRQHVDSLERMNRAISDHVEDFHAEQSAPPAEEEGAILVQTADGKGVPIRRPADAPPIYDHQHKRGPKPDRKKMATIAAVYTVDPYPRTSEDVVQSLFHDPQQERTQHSSRKRPRPCHKRVRACLNHTDRDGEEINGRAAMFGWMTDETSARNRQRDKPLVCIMDGDESLWSELNIFGQHQARIEILDLLHVTPRLWQAAHLLHAPGSRQAEQFVRERVTRILQGDVAAVVRGLRRMASLHDLKGRSRAAMETICQYFEKNRSRMCYDQYLKAGYPIASGVIEGACRHVVKDRMERTGMNWVIDGAKAMLDLRCIYLSNQWEEFMDFYVTQQTRRIHPHRKLLDNLPGHAAA